MRLIANSIYIQCYKIELFLKRIKHHLAFNDPNKGSIVYLSFFESINFFTVLWLLGLPKQSQHKALILLTAVMFFLLNYFCIIKTKKHEEIHKKYTQYSTLEKKLVDLIGIVYLLITLVIPFII